MLLLGMLVRLEVLVVPMLVVGSGASAVCVALLALLVLVVLLLVGLVGLVVVAVAERQTAHDVRLNKFDMVVERRTLCRLQ